MPEFKPCSNLLAAVWLLGGLVSGFCQGDVGTEALRKKLAVYASTPEVLAQAKTHLADLESADYGERRRAMAFLMRATSLQGMLEKAKETASLDVRAALEVILQAHADAGTEEKLRLLMRRVIMEKATGLGPLLLQVWEGRPVTSSDTVRLSRDAIKVTAVPQDLPKFRQAIKSATPHVRELALLGLELLAGEDDEDTLELLRPLLKDEAESVRWRVAIVFAQCEKRESLPVFAELLESETFVIRHQSHELLVAITAEDMGYFSDAISSDRQTAAKLWQRWVAKFGQEAELNFAHARHWSDEEELTE